MTTSRSVITACGMLRLLLGWRSFFFSIGWRHGRQFIRKDTAQSASCSAQTFTWENWSQLQSPTTESFFHIICQDW